MKRLKYIKFLPLMHHEKLEHLGGMCKHLVRTGKNISLYNEEKSLLPSDVNI